MKIAVITAVFGALIPPRSFDAEEGLDYYCYSDEPFHKHPWQPAVLPVGYEDLSPRRRSRVPKLLPHRMQPDYDVWVYWDITMRPLLSVREMIEQFLAEHDLALHKHPWRDCTYDEVGTCCKLKLDDRSVLQAQADRYRERGHPKHWGLFEAGILFRRNTPQIQALNEAWWQEYSTGSQRDQVPLPVVLRESKLPYYTIPGKLGRNQFFWYHNLKRRLK